MMKKCKNCNEIKPLELFSKQKGAYLGCRAQCKTCINSKSKAYTKSYYAEHKIKLKNTYKAWAEKNKAHLIAKNKAYYEANKAYFNEHSSKWKKANSDRNTAIENKRRATKLNATPPWLTKEHLLEIQKFYSEAKRLTKETGIIYEVDHIIPLQGKNVCGLHVPWNLQLLTETENRKKSNKIGDLDYVASINRCPWTGQN